MQAINANAGYNIFAFGHLVGTNYGSSSNYLYYPRGMAVDSAGDVFVVDGGNNRIVEIAAPNPITKTSTWLTFPNTSTPSGDFFYAPEGIAIDSAGDIWVSDTGYNRNGAAPNGRIVHLTTATWQTATPKFDVNHSITIGASNYPFKYPLGLAVNATGTELYIADPDTSFPSNTPYVFAAAVSGSSFAGSAATSAFVAGAANASFPRGLAVDSNGNVYITDETNYHIVEMDSGLTTVKATLGTRGSAAGQFISPQTIAIDSSNNIYVVDSSSYWIVKMSDMFGTGWTRYGVQTGTPSTSVYPNWVAVSPSSPTDIYVSDDTDYQIAEFQ
jgi:sugar lactone lactonase YvrE